MNFGPNQGPTSLPSLEEQEKNPKKDISSWIEEEKWKDDPVIVERVKNIEKFLAGLDPREIGNVLKYGFTSPFTQIYLKSGFNEETSSLLKSRVKDQTLVDLGSGEEIFSILPWLKEAGISEFVGVDKFPNKDLSWYQDKIKQNDLNGNYFKDDMLLFLAKLPDESANVMINGIDHTIISNNEYWEKLKQEIRRVIPKYGVVLGYSSDFSEIEGLKSIKMIKDDNALSILGKE